MPSNPEEAKGNKAFTPFTPGFIVYLILCLAIPGLVGGILSAIFRNLIYLESCFVVGGCLELIIWLWRPRARESAHYRKEKTIVEDKQTKEYRKFAIQQLWMLGFGLLCLALSLIPFLIRRFTA